jgi:hypothetical protein
MKRIIGNTLFILAIIFVPLLLGALIVGPATPVGRNTHSSTRVGHKALFLLYQQLGWDVRRFERGVETLPETRAVLIALEPGPALLREKGAFARGLLEWIERGNAALVTLGPDPDRPAELEDDEGELGASAKRAIELADSLRERAEERAGNTAVEEQRKRAEQEAVAVIDRGEREASDSWDPADLIDFLRLPVIDDRLKANRTSTIALTGVLGEGELSLTRPRVWSADPMAKGRAEYRVLASADGKPLLLELSLGAGKLLVLSEPRLFHNAVLSRGSHAELAVRIVEELTTTADSDVVMFEEFSHGGREASSIFELAVDTRARWLVLHLSFLVLIWIFTVVWRSRSIVPFEVPPRRSRDEVIDAMASLYLRSNDVRGAASRLDELTRLRLGHDAPALDPTTVRTAKDLVERAEALRELRVAADAEK